MTIDPAASHVVHAWKYDASPLISCRFEPQGRFVFAGAQDHRVVRFAMESGVAVPCVGHESWVRAIDFSPDGLHVWTGGYDGRWIQWEVAAESPIPLRTIDAHTGWIRAIVASPDGQRVVTCGNDQLVKIWDAASGGLIHTLTGHDRHVYSLAISPDSQMVFSGDLRGVIKGWKMATGELAMNWEAAQLYSPNAGQGAEYGGIRSMSLDYAKQQLTCGGLHNGANPFGAIQEPLVVVVDLTTGKTIRTLTGKDAPKVICWRVQRHPDGTTIGGCGGMGGGMVLFWRDGEETEFHRFALPNILRDLDVHPDGRQLATAHHDQHLRISIIGA
jgi:WD domain, G-beta repeat